MGRRARRAAIPAQRSTAALCDETEEPQEQLELWEAESHVLTPECFGWPPGRFKQRQLVTVFLLLEPKEALMAVQRIIWAAGQAAGGEGVVGLDCKGQKLGQAGGTLELVAVFVPIAKSNQAEIYLFDVRALGSFYGLDVLLATPLVAKAVYDVRNDAAALPSELGLSSVIDTSVVGLIARAQHFGSSPQIFFGIEKMFEAMCGDARLEVEVVLPSWPPYHHIGEWKAQAWKTSMRSRMAKDTDRKIWWRRPFTPQVLAYAGLNAFLSYGMWSAAREAWGVEWSRTGLRRPAGDGDKLCERILYGTKAMMPHGTGVPNESIDASVPKDLKDIVSAGAQSISLGGHGKQA